MGLENEVESILDGNKSHKCKCDICKRSRKFKEIVEKLDSEEDKEWMMDWLNFYCRIGEDLEATKIYLRGLQIKTGEFVGLGEAIDLIKDFTPTDEEDKERTV